MAVQAVVGMDQLWTTWQDSISVSPSEIWDRYRPVVSSDERTLLNRAVVHQSVNMGFASQIVLLVDSGLGPELYLTQRTQAALGDGLRGDRGYLDKIDNVYPQLTNSWQRQSLRWMDAPKIIGQKSSLESEQRGSENDSLCFFFWVVCDYCWHTSPDISVIHSFSENVLRICVGSPSRRKIKSRLLRGVEFPKMQKIFNSL